MPQSSIEKLLYSRHQSTGRIATQLRRYVGVLHAGPTKIELGFRFLKAFWFMSYTLFLKSPKRIMALMMSMTLCLLVYGALEYRIRKTLQQHQQTFTTQLGTTTAKPTARRLFQFFAGIHVLLIDSCREIVLNGNVYRRQLRWPASVSTMLAYMLSQDNGCAGYRLYSSLENFRC